MGTPLPDTSDIIALRRQELTLQEIADQVGLSRLDAFRLLQKVTTTLAAKIELRLPR
jgi:hypothetical protein